MFRFTWNYLIIFCVLIQCSRTYSGGVCPALCKCNFKDAKEHVECLNAGFIAIPENLSTTTQSIDMSNNSLNTLHSEVFYRCGLYNLQRVILKNCNIGEIKINAFHGISNLIDLNLSGNLLTTIPSKIFKDTRHLRELVLSHNPIQKIEASAFNLLYALVRLDLSYCKIHMIASNAFREIRNVVKVIKLNNNEISEVRPNSIDSLINIHEIELQENPWHCDCRLRGLKEWLIRENIPNRHPPICSGGPERLLHKNFFDLDIEDFACKPEILPTVRYIDAYEDGNATFLCRASGVPEAQISWFWNGKILLNNTFFSADQKIYIFEEGTQDKRSKLVLTNINRRDKIEIYCTARNRAGSSELNMSLRVIERPYGIAAFGMDHIAKLSLGLIVFVLFAVIVSLLLIIRHRKLLCFRSSLLEAGMANGSTIKSPVSSPNETTSFTEQKQNGELSFCNPVQKPPRSNDICYSTVHYSGNGSIMTGFVSPSASANNPDLINDAKMLGDEVVGGRTREDSFMVEPLERPASGEYSRNADSLYPSGLWETDSDINKQVHNNNTNYAYDDKTPIMEDGPSVEGSAEELNFRLTQGTNMAVEYPKDYGLPIMNSKPKVSTAQINNSANAKTLRVWQKGAVPVLPPPVNAFKKVLAYSRNSPDEGYLEGCGTDV